MEWRDASEMNATGDMEAVAREMAERMPRKNPTLPYKGEAGILTRYFNAKLVNGGKGEMSLGQHVQLYLVGLDEAFDHGGVENTASGVYCKNTADPGKLFVNMGSGAVIFEDLPKNDGKVLVNYYGDTLGFRDVDITPFPIASELFRDLNEAFKMMIKYAEKG